MMILASFLVLLSKISSRKLNFLLLILTAVTFISLTNADLFTSIAELQRLIDTEKEIPLIIEQYIKLEEKRLNTLKM